MLLPVGFKKVTIFVYKEDVWYIITFGAYYFKNHLKVE